MRLAAILWDGAPIFPPSRIRGEVLPSRAAFLVGVTMKIKKRFLLPCLVALLASCASSPITLAPVGPSPFARAFPTDGKGRLEVFSRLSEQSDNQNQGDNGGDPIWYQHTDYTVYNSRGKRVEYVDNTSGHYSTSPRIVSLPPGKYTVRAQGKDWLVVNVPVVIERGRTTQVYLDDNWTPPVGTPKADLVCAPNGRSVGWSVEALPLR
jgi:hypothetical protein